LVRCLALIPSHPFSCFFAAKGVEDDLDFSKSALRATAITPSQRKVQTR
jgi:hypothetical protein